MRTFFSRITEQIRRRYGRIPITQRLMLTYSALIIVPLVVFAAVTANVAGTLIREHVLSGASQRLAQASLSVETRVSQLAQISRNIEYSSALRGMMDNLEEPERYGMSEQIQDYRSVDALLTDLTTTFGLHRIRLYLKGSALYTHQRITFFPYEEALAEPRYGELLERGSAVYAHEYPYIYHNTLRVLTHSSAIYSISDYSKLAAIISIDMKVSDMEELLRGSVIAAEGVIVVTGREGGVIAAAGNGALAETAGTLVVAPGETWTELPGGLLAQSRELFGGQLRLVSLFEREMLTRPLQSVLRTTSAILALLVALSYLLTRLSTRLNIDRIRRLAEDMNRVMTGDLSVRARQVSEDEVGVLEKTFNYLMTSVQNLLDTSVQREKELLSADIRLMQAQIKPHFLYNTLDLIRWRALKSGDAEAADMISALARFYRIGLSRGREFIALRDELEHVKLYVQIQNFRYDGIVALTVDVPETLMDCLLLANILQPLAENSIVHGFLEKEPQGGSIRISARLDAGVIILAVQDDGVGMPEEMLGTIVEPSESRSFGVWNVARRIRLMYGEPFGLFYRLLPGGGVMATIAMPFGEVERPPHENPTKS